MNGRTPPQLVTFLFCCLYWDSDREAVLGDLEERFRSGKSTTWYWRQIVGTILASQFRDTGGYKRWGLCIGSLTGIVSIVSNVFRGDRHLVSAFPNALSILLPMTLGFVVALLQHRHAGKDDDVRKKMRRTGVLAGVAFSVMLMAFTAWWFLESGGLRGLWPVSLGEAGFSLASLAVLVQFSGYVAEKVSYRIKGRQFPG